MDAPPFKITAEILSKVSDLAQLVGRFEGLNMTKPRPELRKQNKIRTIHGSLAIEGNTLSLDQVTAILEGKRVLGPTKEIKEVENAIRLYEEIDRFSYLSIQDLKKAHKILMEGLSSDAGNFRTGNVGVMKGSKVTHVAPKATMVLGLMTNLFAFIKLEKQLPMVIRSAVFHYELEFIHPFSDGNGRMGRFWQHIMLAQYNPIFEFVPFETLIKKNQKNYYDVLGKCDQAGDCSDFILFILDILLLSLDELYSQIRPEPLTAEDRLDIARLKFGDQLFARRDYTNLFKAISTATASRDLQKGVAMGLIDRKGDKAVSRYCFLK